MTQQLRHGSYGSVRTLLSTEIQSLTAFAYSALGPEIDNSNGAITGQLTLCLNSAAYLTGNQFTLLAIPSYDGAGTGYPTLRGPSIDPPGNYRIADVTIPGTTAVHTITLWPITLPPGKIKFAAMMNSGCPVLLGGNFAYFYETPVQVASL